MDYKKFQKTLDQIVAGQFPSFTGVWITAEQYLEIVPACASLIKEGSARYEVNKIGEYLGAWRTRIGADFSTESSSIMPIMERINKVIQEHESKGESLIIIHGDKVSQTANFNLYGDPQSAAMAFAALLDDKDSDLKRFIFSILGVYLAKNPEGLAMFLRGIEMSKQTPGVN